MKKRESSLPSTGKTAAFERDWKEEEAKISAFEVILAKSLWIAKGIGGGGETDGLLDCLIQGLEAGWIQEKIGTIRDTEVAY